MSQQSVTDCDSEPDALGSPEDADEMLDTALNIEFDVGGMGLQGSQPDELDVYRLHSADEISKNTLIAIHKLQNSVNDMNEHLLVSHTFLSFLLIYLSHETERWSDGRATSILCRYSLFYKSSSRKATSRE